MGENMLVSSRLIPTIISKFPIQCTNLPVKLEKVEGLKTTKQKWAQLMPNKEC